MHKVPNLPIRSRVPILLRLRNLALKLSNGLLQLPVQLRRDSIIRPVNVPLKNKDRRRVGRVQNLCGSVSDFVDAPIYHRLRQTAVRQGFQLPFLPDTLPLYLGLSSDISSEHAIRLTFRNHSGLLQISSISLSISNSFRVMRGWLSTLHQPISLEETGPKLTELTLLLSISGRAH